jgi:hypothetical protein
VVIVALPEVLEGEAEITIARKTHRLQGGSDREPKDQVSSALLGANSPSGDLSRLGS